MLQLAAQYDSHHRSSDSIATLAIETVDLARVIGKLFRERGRHGTPRAMQAYTDHLLGQPEASGGLGGVELQDIAQHHHLAVALGNARQAGLEQRTEL